MAGLQRSAVSFRRQGSSGLIWDDKFLSGELNQVKPEQEQEPTKQVHEQSGQDQDKADFKDVRPSPIKTMERSRSNGERRGYRTGKVSPAIEPPSPKVSACGFCGAFRKPAKNPRKNLGKRRSR